MFDIFRRRETIELMDLFQVSTLITETVKKIMALKLSRAESTILVNSKKSKKSKRSKTKK
jgi:hypothetical protein